MLKQWCWALVILLVEGFSVLKSHAQIDPVKRELVQLGYNQPLEGHAPISGYAFYYYNQPSFLRTNLTLRLAVAPVYMDSELGFGHLLGAQTDFGLGLAGGGFADSYSEVRGGQYLKSESFTGHGGNVSANIYHLFNPSQEIPLNGILRGEIAETFYDRDSDTAQNFVLPSDRTTLNVRAGMRWGGKEPVLMPSLGMELSVWYEGKFRLNTGSYGFAGDRRVEPDSHLFWSRALLAYTVPERGNHFLVSLTGGVSAEADRFSAYRIGGVLPLASEFPLSIPGYYYQELTSTRFVLLNGSYYQPLDSAKRWELSLVATTAFLDYLPGLEQAGHWHSGVGGGITYRPKSEAWQFMLAYGYGIDAIRGDNRGAHSVGFLVQFDLERARTAIYEPGPNTSRSRGFDRFLRLFQ